MPEFVIARKQLYILPTRIGWYYSLIIIALFAIAVKFDNQAAFMMLFLLVSIAMVAMLYTHNNIIGLGLSSQPSRSVFLGEIATFSICAHNQSQAARNAVWLVADGFHQLLELPPQGEKQVQLKLPTVKRGYLNCSPVTLTSHFPIGMFFCWTKRFTPGQRCLVYPQALNLIPLPSSGEHSSEQQNSASVQPTAEDYSGMKPYQAGDRLRDVHWPSFAKTQKLVTIQHESHSSSAVNLSWFSLPANLSVEDKLSQLCYWVVDAEKSSNRYQLEMPNHTVQYNQGLAHYHECLTVLALWA